MEEFEARARAQGYKCAVCGEKPAGSLHLDHDHATGEHRGLLCRSCNVLIGHARESPAILEAAKQYLFRHGKV